MIAERLALGSYTFGPEDGWLHLNTWKKGLLSRLGHDLLLSAELFQLNLEVNESNASIHIALRVAKDGFVVLGPESLSADNRRQIQSNIKGHLPQDITFSGQARSQTSGESWLAQGQLSVGRQAASVQMTLAVSGSIVIGSVRLSHKALGIKPYSAPLGLIQLKDEIDLSVHFDISALLT